MTLTRAEISRRIAEVEARKVELERRRAEKGGDAGPGAILYLPHNFRDDRELPWVAVWGDTLVCVYDPRHPPAGAVTPPDHLPVGTVADAPEP